MRKGPHLFSEGHVHLQPRASSACLSPFPSYLASLMAKVPYWSLVFLLDSGTRVPGSHPRLGLFHPDPALPGTQPFPDSKPHPGISVPSPSSASVLRSVDLNPKCASLITIINRLLNEAANTVNGIFLMTLHKENEFYDSL